MAVTWVGNIGSSVSWSFCFLVRVRGGGTTGGGRDDISPGGAVSGGGLGSWSVGEWSDRIILCFPFRVITGAMIRATLDSVVGLWSTSCIGVSSIPLYVLWMLSKASYGNPSSFQSALWNCGSFR